MDSDTVKPGKKPEFQELVEQQCRALQQLLLSEHRSELDALRRKLTEPEAPEAGSSREEVVRFEESPAVFHRWADLTVKLMNEQDWLESVTGLDPVETQKSDFVHDLHMLRPWTTNMMTRRRRNNRKSMHMSPTNQQLKINEAQRDDDSLLQRFVVGPQSNIQLFWSVAACLLIMWDMITIPLELFDASELADVQSVVNIVTFVFWLTDMPLNCFFGVHRHGVVELRPRVLFQLYLRSWFGVDLLIISIDVARFIAEAAFGGTMSQSLSSGRYLRALRILRLLRLTRIGKLQKKFALLANRFLSTYVFMVLKVVWTLMLMLAINHVIACCWYGVATLTLDGSTWLTAVTVNDRDVNIFDLYVASLHWSLTQFTPSTNNIAPANALERSFAVFVILLAMGFFSSFVGSITSTVNSLRNIQAAKVKQQDTLLQFFVERNMSLDLYSKVQEVIRSENLAEVRLHESDVALVNSLPERFRMQLHEEMYMHSLLTVRCWPKNLPENELFLRLLCHHAMSEIVVKRGEDLFLPNGDCHYAFFLEPGHGMKYVSHGKKSIVMPGDSLCLPCLWAEWHYCGRCTAEFGAGYCNRVHGETVATMAMKFGGQVSRYLQIFGILLIGAIESEEDPDDLCYDDEKMDQLAVRAKIFAEAGESRGPTRRQLLEKSLSRENLPSSPKGVPTLGLTC